jgi:hypothetical protein
METWPPTPLCGTNTTGPEPPWAITDHIPNCLASLVRYGPQHPTTVMVTQGRSAWFSKGTYLPTYLPVCKYEGVSKSFRTGRLERELQIVQLSATRCSCIAILWVSLASFAAITLCVDSQRVFIVVIVYFVIDSVRKSRNSSVGKALGYGLDDRGCRVRFPAGAGNFSLRRVQNGSGAHPVSYPMGTRGSFPGGKAAGAWSSPLTSI